MTGPDRMAYHEDSGGKRSWFQRVCLLQSGGTPNGATETAALPCVVLTRRRQYRTVVCRQDDDRAGWDG